MLLYAWHEPGLKSHLSLEEVEAAPGLDALFARLLVHAMRQRLRLGLGQAYMSRTQTLRTVRGRINFAESLRNLAFERGEATSDIQQYSANEPRNQIVRSTLMRLIQAGEFGSERKQAEALLLDLRRLVRDLDGIDLIELTPEFIRRFAEAQNDRDYRFMLALCELVWLRHMPADAEGTRSRPGLDREALVLHRVYERFVAGFYRLHLKDWEVDAQKHLDWHAEQFSEHLPAMIPDLVLRHRETGQVIVLDTKFTAGSLVENQWGKRIYDSSHLYQLYAYLRSQEHLSEAQRAAQGILLYPAVDQEGSEKVELQGHEMRVEWVDLAAAWQDVEKRLLQVIEPDSP
jgi:5-methylcytosine-specific restriction enzyme subunit McrC